MNRSRMLQRGVSLIEAVVALAVMAFGILGVVGVQSTLRFNADVARQRAEAVRIAQENIEAWRGFTVMTMPSPANGHTTALADIQTDSSPTTVAGTNASFSVLRQVTTVGGSTARALTVQVSWADRTGVTQSVVLNSQVAGILPEISGTLALAPKNVAGSPAARGRSAVIPPGATDLGNGSSSYAPPGAPTGVTWTFNNTTGVITSICTITTTTTCIAGDYVLLAGFVDFALTATAPGPTGADAERPTSNAFPLAISVNQTAPSTGVVTCYQPTITPLTYIPYACAVPVSPTAPHVWSGQSVLSGLTIASSAADATASSFRVCRYTPALSNATVVTALEHPLTYNAVETSLPSQNFLVIRAGDGTTAFACPPDGSDPFINGNTLPHQPAS